MGTIGGLAVSSASQLDHRVFRVIATGAWSFDPEYTWYQVTP